MGDKPPLPTTVDFLPPGDARLFSPNERDLAARRLDGQLREGRGADIPLCHAASIVVLYGYCWKTRCNGAAGGCGMDVKGGARQERKASRSITVFKQVAALWGKRPMKVYRAAFSLYQRMPLCAYIDCRDGSVLRDERHWPGDMLEIDRATCGLERNGAGDIGGPDGPICITQGDRAVEAIGLQCAAIHQVDGYTTLAGDAHLKIHPGVLHQPVLYIGDGGNGIAVLVILHLDGISKTVPALFDKNLIICSPADMDVSNGMAKDQRRLTTDRKTHRIG